MVDLGLRLGTAAPYRLWEEGRTSLAVVVRLRLLLTREQGGRRGIVKGVKGSRDVES